MQRVAMLAVLIGAMAVGIRAQNQQTDWNKPFARLDKGGPNPFIDPAGFKAHLDRQEKNFNARLDEQKKGTTR